MFSNGDAILNVHIKYFLMHACLLYTECTLTLVMHLINRPTSEIVRGSSRGFTGFQKPVKFTELHYSISGNSIRNIGNGVCINNSFSKNEVLNIQMTKMLKQFVVIASSDGVMKSKQVIKWYSLQTMNYFKDLNHVHPSSSYKRLGRSVKSRYPIRISQLSQIRYILI